MWRSANEKVSISARLVGMLYLNSTVEGQVRFEECVAEKTIDRCVAAYDSFEMSACDS